ncbi:MAG: hypothetical protein R3C56_07435 [Pirellulaceae bacterium]
MRIELFPFAHVFRKDSRIRLAVSGPGGAVNAWPWAFESIPGEFDVHIAHGGQHSSSMVLPVVHPTDLSLPASLPACDSVALSTLPLGRLKTLAFSPQRACSQVKEFRCWMGRSRTRCGNLCY